MEFFNFLMFDVLSEPAVLVGLIALIGLIAQKKPVTECIKGTVKTIMGFVILGAGDLDNYVPQITEILEKK